MSEKKVYSKTFVIALGVICIISLSGLVSAILYYPPIINDKDDIIKTKNIEINELNNQIPFLQDEINNLKLYKQLHPDSIYVTNAYLGMFESGITVEIELKYKDIKSLEGIGYFRLKDYVYVSFTLSDNGGEEGPYSGFIYHYKGSLPVPVETGQYILTVIFYDSEGEVNNLQNYLFISEEYT